MIALSALWASNSSFDEIESCNSYVQFVLYSLYSWRKTEILC